MHLENDRNKVSDGNYLLWQADMAAFGCIVDLPLILEQIGAIALMAHEAKQEQDGTVCRELPVATDPRFIVETDNQEPEAAQEPEPRSEANQEETDNDKEATE